MVVGVAAEEVILAAASRVSRPRPKARARAGGIAIGRRGFIGAVCVENAYRYIILLTDGNEMKLLWARRGKGEDSGC